MWKILRSTYAEHNALSYDIEERGGGHIVGSSYTVGKILRSTYAEHNHCHMMAEGGGVKNCLGY